MVNACLQPPLNDFRELMYHVAQSNLFREPVEDICNSLFRHLEKPVTLFASLLCKDGTWYTPAVYNAQQAYLPAACMECSELEYTWK